MNKREKAEELFKEGYNCSQAVLGAFCDELGIDEKIAFRLSSSFGGGMGRLREVCGAVSGMFMVAGLASGYSDPEDLEAKKKHYALIQELAKAFADINDSIICRELLGLTQSENNPTPEKRTEEYYQKRPCVELVKDAAEITEKIVFGNK